MNKAYKFRAMPNAEQRVLFAKTVGCARFVYNSMLADKIAHYKETSQLLHNTPAQYKAEFPFLREVDSLALCNAQLQVQTAYKNFFRDKSIGFPKFRSKKSSRKAYTTNWIKGNIAVVGNCLKLPKMGLVRVKFHRQIPDTHQIKSVTFSQEPSGKYYVSILTEYEANIPERPLDTDKALGLDYSSPHFYVDSQGVEADMPHFYRQAEQRLVREQRKLSKMVKGSANYQKQKRRVSLAHEKVRNQRKDWQHKRSRELAGKWDIICVEDINYKGMSGSLRLGKATQDNGFGQFRTFLSYKLAEQGKKLVTIDKWFPSSKLCRHCGCINDRLTLSDRVWICPSCGETILRDENAAVNIRNAGVSQIA